MKEKLNKQPEQTTEDDPENELESPDDEGNPSGARFTAQQDPASEGPPSRRLRSMTHGSELISWDSVDPTLECVGVFSDVGALCLNTTAITPGIPSSFYECLQTKEREEWQAAYTSHMAGKMGNNTCTWVPLPQGERCVKTKLVPSHKYNKDGTIKEYTMRWVACGYSQVPGRDFRLTSSGTNATFSATPKATSTRLFMCLIWRLGLMPKKADVPKAFTRAKIDVEMYVSQPEEKMLPGLMCSKRDDKGRYYVGRLHRALEGLRQSGNLFEGLNVSVLTSKEIGGVRLETEPTFIVIHKSDGLLLINLWTDDFAMGVSSESFYQWFMKTYRSLEGLDIKDEGKLEKFAGMQVEFDGDYVRMHQEAGIAHSIEKFFPQAIGLKRTTLPATYDSNSRKSSLDGCALATEDDPREYVQKYPAYLNMVAVGLYYAYYTHPEVLFVFTLLARYSCKPNEPCFVGLLNALSYLYFARKERLTFNVRTWALPPEIISKRLSEKVNASYGAYFMPDSSWKMRTDTEQNMTYGGFLFFMFGGCMDWNTRLIRVICASSSEAEMAAGAFAGKRGQFVRSLINEMKEKGVDVDIGHEFVYLIDNSACDGLTSNVGTNKKTEHFLRWQYFLRWLVYHKYAIVLWTGTEDQTGDVLTKVLPSHSFIKHTKTIRGCNAMT